MRLGTANSLRKLCIAKCAELIISQTMLPTELIKKIEFYRARRILLTFKFVISHPSNQIRCVIRARDRKKNIICDEISREDVMSVLKSCDPLPQFVHKEYSKLMKRITKIEKFTAEINDNLATFVKLTNFPKIEEEKTKMIIAFVKNLLITSGILFQKD